jgi:CheY-like chemotaxis protein/HPt (histidine-containing phosphotransfer) domain-containing protein
VEEIILNLLSNAVKYTRQGFIKFAVRGQRDRRGNIFLTFDVSDSGIGIKPEDVDTLFADFSRIDNKYNIGTQGAGLGLAITRALCRMMGGNVVVKSQYEVGSTFTASFNQGIADASPMGAFKENSAFIDERAGSADFIAPDFRVLIVDDNMTNLQVTERLLASYQMEMDTCLSGLEAVAIVQQKEYDLVLVDTMMPGIDNLETAAEIRGLGVKFKKLPIVALAANAVGRMKTVFLNKGFNDCLSKPIEMSNLKALLEKIVPAEKKVKGKARATTDGRGQTITGTSPRIQAALDSQAANGGMSAKTPPDSTRLDQIDGLDTKKGMANTGGAPSAYQGVLEVYCRDARNRFELLSAESAESDLKNYITNVHALKSASASIGAIGLSEAAAVLEAAGLRGNMEYIRRATADFRNRLIDLTEQIEIAMVVEKDTEPLGAGRETNNGQSNASVAPALAALKEALEKEDIGRTDRLLAELSMMHPSPEAGKLISRVTELVLTSEFQAAAKYMGDAIGGHVTP